MEHHHECVEVTLAIIARHDAILTNLLTVAFPNDIKSMPTYHSTTEPLCVVPVLCLCHACVVPVSCLCCTCVVPVLYLCCTCVVPVL